MPNPLRIFFSSPSDVIPERRRAVLVVEKLAKEYSRFFQIIPVLWETEPMIASGHFQDAIIPPSETDILVLILWSRLGTPLPERTEHHEYRGIDGRLPVTGTEWEFENALQAKKAKGLPDLLAYRKTAKPRAEFATEAEAIDLARQFKMLNVFWDRYFVNQGEFRAAFWQFEDLGDFEQRLDLDLRRLIERRIADLRTDTEKPFTATWYKGNPFRGLETYRFEHAAIFFGRSDATKTAVEHLVENAECGRPFLLILGASGAGKSSLAQAGVVPALGVRGVVRGVGEWRRAIMRPAQDPGGLFASLAAALSAEEALPELLRAQDVAGFSRHLEASVTDPAFPVAAAIIAREKGAHDSQRLARHETVKLVLVVDQLEELFTLGDVTPQRRRAFIACLEGLVNSGYVFVVATMRSDYWHRASELPRLVALAEGRGRFDLLNAGQAEITEMIRRPAEVAGLSFETDPRTEIRLDAALAEETASEPGALPLLSFLLDALYSRDVESGKGSTLSYASMRALGGLQGAIANRAEAAFAALPPQVQTALPKVLRALVTVSRSGAEPTARDAPMKRFAEGSDERRIVDALVHPQMRLLVAEGDGDSARVRLAHEAMITHWDRAKRQIAQDRDDLRTRAAVEEAQVDWRSGPISRKRDYLLRDPQLANAIDLLGRWRGELDTETEYYIRLSHRRARLRQRLTAGAAVVFGLVAILAILAAGAAIREQKRAEAERQLAQQTLAAATKTANSLIFDLAQRFRDAVGIPTEVVKDILQRAMALQGELTASGQATPDLQFSAADAFAENAQTLLVQGDSEGSLQAAERANSILQNLLLQDPTNKRWRHDLSVSYERIGDAQLALGKRQDALQAYQESLNGRRQLAADFPGDSEYQRNVALGYVKIGDVLSASNRPSDALASYHHSLAIEQDAINSGQSGPAWQHALSISYERIGDVLTGQGNLDDALPAYRNSLDIRQKLAADDPGNAGRQRDLSISYERIGDVMSAKARRDDLIAAAQNSLEIETHPIVAEQQKGLLASSTASSANHQNVDAEFMNATNMYRRGLATRQRLADGDKANAQWQRDLSITYVKLADILAAQQKYDDALAAYQMSLTVAQGLPVSGEGNVEWQRDRYVTQERIGDVLVAQGKFDDALAVFQQSLMLRRKLTAVDPGNATWQRDLFIIQDKIGDLQLTAGLFDEAMTSYHDSLDIRQRLASNFADDVELQRALWVGHIKVGDALVAQGKRDDAMASYANGALISQENHPRNDEPSRNLVFGLNRGASILMRLGQPTDAISYLDALLQITPNDLSVYYDRGRAEIYSGQFSAANDDLAKALTLKPDNPYLVIWRHIGRQRGDESDQQEFIYNAGRLNKVQWPWPVIALFLGLSDPQSVHEAVQSGDSPRVRLERGCEADFYVAVYALERNVKDDALKLLQFAAVRCPENFVEEAAAKLELARLKAQMH
jgi:tetratricopeptide (TPR) repeat protein